MTIYNINFGIGWASSGVEYAQAYRAKLLRNTNCDMKFVFLDFIQSENIQTLTSNMGFKDEEIIWLYQYFSDIKIAPTTYTIEDIKRSVGSPITRVEHVGKIKRLYLNNDETFITCYLKEADKDFVDRAEFVVNSMLIRKDFYSYVRIFSEYYAPSENKAKLYMRQFYNEDGSIVYNEYIDGESCVYAFDNAILYSKAEFVAYFMRQLQLDSEDIVILDRATEVGQAILQNKGSSHIGVVVHAEHFSENSTDEQYILWNNYYGYVPRIRTIPVGSLHQLKYPEDQRKPFSMITASRLASEKHIDWLVRAAIKAKQQVPELTFDIYGEGAEKSNIAQIINEFEAQEYIRLLGHVNLDRTYINYDLFVSASTSEGFGLTLMEAVGSGLGMIGFNVNYGNPTFIRNQKNGYLIPISLQQDELEDIVTQLANHMVKYFNDGPTDPHQESYEIAEPFMTSHVQVKWLNLIEEVLHD